MRLKFKKVKQNFKNNFKKVYHTNAKPRNPPFLSKNIFLGI